ncbi:MAG: bifunctional phosphopantothenoylcysteine decarboxylase/phosphopantothenate--cysteine ligase CoaBC [Rickettsiales bacterium]|nr:bifunctional phosphopantothenoylcysteine decarboxylase/phosphopantothenate--cysteine ligase CoaBC [Rickettsiales bacterium]
MNKILFIITGSVACYKAVEAIRLLKKQNYQITPILTKGGAEFITPLLLTSISGNETLSDLFCANQEAKINHIELSRSSDLIVVAPASADFIAKIANGYADDLASTTIIASNKRLVIAPAMNERMWNSASNIENIEKLRARGVVIIEPEIDILACGEIGVGKMANINVIIEKINNTLSNQRKLQGKKIIISGGATFEAIDSVRFIGNFSSGMQAISIAEELYLSGAEVIFVASNIFKPINLPSSQIIRVKNSQQMHKAILENLSQSFAFISCAAVCDFKIKNFSISKIKKGDKQNLTLELEQNIDILKDIANNKSRPPLVIGFAAEDADIDTTTRENMARQKLEKKNCDIIVANSLQNGKVFGNEFTEAIIIDKSLTNNLGIITKKFLAKKIVELIISKI